jgi:hypothetical protein
MDAANSNNRIVAPKRRMKRMEGREAIKFFCFSSI